MLQFQEARSLLLTALCAPPLTNLPRVSPTQNRIKKNPLYLYSVAENSAFSSMGFVHLPKATTAEVLSEEFNKPCITSLACEMFSLFHGEWKRQSKTRTAGLSVWESCLAGAETVSFSELPSTTSVTLGRRFQTAAPHPKQVLSKHRNALNALKKPRVYLPSSENHFALVVEYL